MNYYAQDELDKWIEKDLNLGKNGVMVDVGAGDGVNMSNSKHFEEIGWKVVCIDADPRVAEALKKNRKIAHSALISNQLGKMDFHMSRETPDISGIIETEGNKDLKQEMELVTLESILEKEEIGKIDILSIDTEGTEIDVFESMNWEKHKPRILIIEYDTQGNKNKLIEPYFTGKGYNLVSVIGPNMVFAIPQPIKRSPHLMVYGSSYDRGLEHLLKMWPDIKKAVPDASLHIFYGWDLFDLGYGDNPERMAWKEKINIAMNQPGIVHLGRISHGAVQKEFEMAGVWAYPTHFGEINCITAMKAQAWGSIPCVIDYAALKETVKFGVKIKGDIYDQETKDLYKNSLIALLKDKKYQEEVRKEMMPWAKEHFAWSNVAKQWTEEFRKFLKPEERAMQLILIDEPLEALKLLEKDSPLRQKLVRKLDHIFNYDKYLEKYANDPMNWKPGTIDNERYRWVLEETRDAKTLIDLGCYEGSIVDAFGKGAKGVEMCKAAVEYDQKRGLNVVQGDACTYNDGNKYDAVCALEVIEHVPNPKKLIENMVSLLSENGWCYLTTPNGCFDSADPLKVWQDEDALINHVRTYSEEKIKKLLGGCDIEIAIEDRNLFVKFRPNIEKQVGELMENNEALKAWDLVKDKPSNLRDKVWQTVKHAFNYEEYLKYYSKDLVENPVPEEYVLDCTKLFPRFDWLVGKVEKQKPKTVVDLGCADGYVALTLAKRGLVTYGVNLYEPSIKLATERASNYHLPAFFKKMDLMKYKQKHDAVILFEVLEHVPDPQETIDHCMSLVNPGGSLYLSTPSPEHLGIELHKQEEHGDWYDGKPAGHLRIFTREDMLKLLKGYKIKEFVMDPQGCFLLEVRNDERQRNV